MYLCNHNPNREIEPFYHSINLHAPCNPHPFPGNLRDNLVKLIKVLKKLVRSKGNQSMNKNLTNNRNRTILFEF